MIILDTNVIYPHAPTDPTIELIASVAAATGHGLLLPVIAWDEYQALMSRDLNAAFSDLESAFEKVRALAPGWTAEVPHSPARQTSTDRNVALQQRFRPSPTARWAPAEGLQREIERRPPASTGKGARDTALWVSALTTMAESANEDELLIFFSGNTADFANGRTRELLPALIEDVNKYLGAGAHRFRYCAHLPDLLEVVGATVSSVDASERDSVWASPVLRQVLTSALTRPEVFMELTRTIAAGLGVLRSGGLESVDLTTWRRAQRVVVGEDAWLIFSGTWRAVRHFDALGDQPGSARTTIAAEFTTQGTVVAALDTDHQTIRAADITGLAAPRLVAANVIGSAWDDTPPIPSP